MRGKYRKNYIKDIRIDRGMLLESLAAAVGMTNQNVSSIELSKSRLSIDQLERFASALCCIEADILYGVGNERK